MIKNELYSIRKIIKIDITNDPLPEADLWLCRDCFIHFSNKDIFNTLINYLNADITYLLTTTYPNTRKNKDIHTGDFHPINLEFPPFNFCNH